MDTNAISQKIAWLLVEILTLKNTTRAGWARVGVPPGVQETVATHSFGAGVVAAILSAVQGDAINAGRATMLAVLHDIGETRTGDIAHPLRDIIEEQGLPKEQVDQRAEQLQRQGLPVQLQAFLRTALEEFRSGESLEAKTAKDAEFIELGIQALRYQGQGYPTGQFIEGIAASLQTEAGQQLWELIRGDPEIFTAWFSRQT
jgi:putative hydrolases of HD superfamily